MLLDDLCEGYLTPAWLKAFTLNEERYSVEGPLYLALTIPLALGFYAYCLCNVLTVELPFTASPM